jgi:hypothetical protein
VKRRLPILALALLSACGGPSMKEIEYRGYRIKLARAYMDYDEYKNDPENIHPMERALVQQLVKGAPVASSYPDATTLYQSLSELTFPGYGSGRMTNTPQPDGSFLVVYGLEIPLTAQQRYLLFRTVGSTFLLVDEFLGARTQDIAVVNDLGREWVYRSTRGAIVFRRTKAGA